MRMVVETPACLANKFVVVAVASCATGIAAIAGWRLGMRRIEPGALHTVWVMVGGVSAAGYALSWPGERQIASWLALPLSNRALVWRLTTGDRWAAGAFAVLAGVFGVSAGIAGTWGLAGTAEALVAPVVVAFVVIPFGLLFLRLGQAASWIGIVSMICGATAALFPGTEFPPSAFERYSLGLMLVLLATIGWASLGTLPGRSRLRRLAFGRGSRRRPTSRVGRRTPACRRGRRMTIAGLLLQSADPTWRLRRLAWFTPAMALASWLSWWLQAQGMEQLVVAMPMALAGAITIPAVFGLTEVVKDDRRLASTEPADWGFSLDPLPVAPGEIVEAGLRIRGAMALGVLALCLPAIFILCETVESQAILIFFSATFLPLPLHVAATELGGTSPERPPPEPLSRGAKRLMIVLSLIVLSLPLLILSGRLQPALDALVGGHMWLADSPAGARCLEAWRRIRHVVDGSWLADPRLWALAVGAFLIWASIDALRRAIRARRDRSTDIWP